MSVALPGRLAPKYVEAHPGAPWFVPRKDGLAKARIAMPLRITAAGMKTAKVGGDEIQTDSHPVADSATSTLGAKRQVILRDSLIFFVLVVATLILYGITSFLFRSFAARRADLARHYAASGQTALRQGHPEQAITSLRVALSYAPDDHSSHLLLAEALAEAHHTAEATNYFLTLRDMEPANGFINLELARLARQRGDTAQAIRYYRASTLGNWGNDSLTLRRQVQFELSDYLIQTGDRAGARAELLVAAANAPETASLDVLFGDKLRQANDPTDAQNFYLKAIKLEPRNFEALSKAGGLAYSMGDYSAADKLLTHALKERPKVLEHTPQLAELKTTADNAARLLYLNPSKNLPIDERAEHLHNDAIISRLRFNVCAARFDNAGSLPSALQSLKSQWQSAAKLIDRRAALENPTIHDNLTQLVFNTELQTSQFCGPPTGDNALLLLLAKSSPQSR